LHVGHRQVHLRAREREWERVRERETAKRGVQIRVLWMRALRGVKGQAPAHLTGRYEALWVG
jgi:hypothetical protein